MRRIIILMLILFLSIISSGCSLTQRGINNSEASNQHIDSTNENSQFDEAGTSVTNWKEYDNIENEDEKQQSDNEISETEEQNTDQSQNNENNSKEAEKNNDIIIVKSENMVSSEEKEQILNEIDKLLDGLLKDINDLEDVDEEDLEDNE